MIQQSQIDFFWFAYIQFSTPHLSSNQRIHFFCHYKIEQPMSLFRSRVKLQKRVQQQFNGFVQRRIHTQTTQHLTQQMEKVSFPSPSIKSVRFNKRADRIQSKPTKAKIGSMYLDIIVKNFGQKSKIHKINFDLEEEKQNIIENLNTVNLIKKSKNKKKNISFAVPRHRSSIAEQIFQQKQQSKASILFPQFDSDLLKIEVKKICECLEQLLSFGLVEKKLNTWCKTYFDSKKKTLIDIFMKKYIKKKSLNNQLTFVVINKEDHLLSNVLNATVNSSQKERQSLGVEISLYRNFLEDKIANKQRLELNQLENRVKSNVEQPQSKQLARQLYKQEPNSTELASFYTDMQRIEQAYGPLTLISIKNRKRYENINKSEINIRKIIYE